MNWRTIGTFAAVIAAILTIAFNAFVQWKQLRRERMVVLKKALLNLLEIRQVVEAAYLARLSKNRISEDLKHDASEIEKVIRYDYLQVFDSVIFDGSTTKRKNLQEIFKEIVQNIGGEDPFLALQLSSCNDFLQELDVQHEQWRKQQESKPKVNPTTAKEAMVVKMVEQRTPDLPPLAYIGSVLDSLDNSINDLSKLCNKKVQSSCQEYIKIKNENRDREQERKKEEIGEGLLEKLDAQRQFVRKFLPKEE